MNVVHTLGLFGCARGAVAVTGDPNMSLFFLPGGFSRCRVCTGVDASKIPLPLPPGGFIRFGMFLGSSVGPKILDAILLGLLEGTPSSGLPKRLLDSPSGGFMDLEPD